MYLRRTFALSLVFAGISLTGAGALAASGAGTAWMIEPTSAPRYATIEPASTDLNIDTVRLVCEEGPNGRFLQLQLYQTEEGLLASSYDHSAPTRDEPRADITIDGQRFAAKLLQAENYAVLGDERDGDSLKVSDRLLRTLETGKTMKLRIDLLAEVSAAPASETVVDLQRPGKAQAISAMRRCAHGARSTMR
jgi:hypothetical protein